MIRIYISSILIGSFLCALGLGIIGLTKENDINSLMAFIKVFPVLIGFSCIAISVVTVPLSKFLSYKIRNDFWSLNFSKFILLISLLSIVSVLGLILYNQSFELSVYLIFVVYFVSAYLSNAIILSYITIKENIIE